ncbi:hypothetical protein HPP92_013872 [Vanilla planifolia]|uniref:Uncharacterized protein n=1 Tax=Vanilla planifolia TaxID=51239 RepID=A0A835UZA0_VANPL|nr:hypothetical protein HPP92_013872 [Vanilla planifolia]
MGHACRRQGRLGTLTQGGRAIEVGRDPAWVVEWAVPRIGEGGETALEVTDGRLGVGEGMEVVVEKMMDVAARCVSKEWSRRPRMEEVAEELERAVERVWRPVCGVGEVVQAVGRWMQGWRRRREKRVTSTATTKIIYEIDGGD